MSLSARPIFRFLCSIVVFIMIWIIWSVQSRADEQRILLSQLSLELGPKSKCGGDDSNCREGTREHSNRKEHSKKNSNSKIIEGGIGIILQVPNTTVRKQRKKGGGDASSAPVSAKKKKPPAKPANSTAAKDKKKPKPKPAGRSTDPKDKPIFVPPEFPAIALRDCEDCWELWISILNYESIISEDSRRLFERRADIEDRRAEIDDLRSKLGSAGSIDKVYYTREIQRHEEYIEAIEQLNKELEKLVAEEWKILQDRMGQYAECIDRHCPVPETVSVTEDPVNVPPPLPQPETPPASEPQPEYTTTDWGPKISVGLDTSGLGYKWSMDESAGPYPARFRPPADDRKICGPDITQAVINTLRKIRKEFTESPEKQAAACRSLIDPRTGGTAWDILQLSPGVAVPATGPGQTPFTYEAESDSWVRRGADGKPVNWVQPWFTGSSHLCAIPRADPVCAPTVEFLGICEHAQVVNYVQWQFMLGLCGGAYPYAGPLLHRAWNLFQYGGGAPAASQINMSTAAEKILEKLDANPDETDFSEVSEALKALDDIRTDKPIKACELKCGIKIEGEFSYVWTGMTRPRGIETGRLERDLRDIGGAGLDKVRSKISQQTGVDVDELRPGYVFDQTMKSVGR